MTEEATEFLMDAEMPRAQVTLLLEHFSHLADGREPQRVMYPPSEVLFYPESERIQELGLQPSGIFIRSGSEQGPSEFGGSRLFPNDDAASNQQRRASSDEHIAAA